MAGLEHLMHIIDTIQHAQVRAGEAAVIADLERTGLGGLWAVHIRGSGSVPAPSHAEAQAACVLLNAAYARRLVAGVQRQARVAAWNGGIVDHRADQHLFRDLLAEELSAAWE